MSTTYPTITGSRRAMLLLLLFVVTALISACMGGAQPPSPVYYYTLNQSASDTRFNTALPCTLRVERFSVSPPFNSQRIFYADSASHRNSYAYHQWVVPPGELLPYLFAGDLRSSNGFRAVLTPDAALSATHSLHGWVEEFIEKDHPEKWQAAVTVHLTLISNLEPDPVAKIMLQKPYRATADSRDKTPAALAEAMSEAVGRITAAAVEDIYRRLTVSPILKY